MKIIDKHKDYYDYIVGLYGLDNKVVYDRRDSVVIDKNIDKELDYYSILNFRNHGNKNNTFGIKKLMQCFCNKKLSWNDSSPWHSYSDDEKAHVFYFALQVGYYKYTFKVIRQIVNGKLDIKYELYSKDYLRIEYYSDAPIYLISMEVDFLERKPKDDLSYDRRQGVTYPKPAIIENPILKNTFISGFISPYDMWNNIYNYLISVSDKKIIDTRTNDQHIESNGFDKKISFRNVK